MTNYIKFGLLNSQYRLVNFTKAESLFVNNFDLQNQNFTQADNPVFYISNITQNATLSHLNVNSIVISANYYLFYFAHIHDLILADSKINNFSYSVNSSLCSIRFVNNLKLQSTEISHHTLDQQLNMEIPLFNILILNYIEMLNSSF